MSINKTEIYIEEYSEKSFVVRGDTRPYRDSLKALGGKWANRLTDKNNGEKFGAWLFWSAKLPEVNTWIKKGGVPSLLIRCHSSVLTSSPRMIVLSSISKVFR